MDDRTASLLSASRSAIRSAFCFLAAERPLHPITKSPITKAVIPTAKNIVTTKPDVVRVLSINKQTSSPDAAVVHRTPAAHTDVTADVVTHPMVTPLEAPVPYEHTLVE